MTNRNYKDPLYKEWRKNIYKRDNHTCQWPNCNNIKKLHAHHIRKWSLYPGLRFHPDNGITLCKTHHDMIKNQEENYAGIFLKLLANKKNV
jgi:5-methylcytosine-specific restriction endonuclease McrA